MIAKEFLKELEGVHELFEWKLLPDATWSSERRGQPRLCIRAVCKYGPAGFVFEPIGAVCYIRNGDVHGVQAWLEAATAIQLSLIDAGDLTAAANDRTWVNVAGRRSPDPYMQRLRKQLTDAVGLKN